MSLDKKKCIPCSGDIPPLPEDKIHKLKKQISPEWKFTHNNTRLLRKISLHQMAKPMELANKIAKIADEEWHHPELHVGFGHLDIEIWTHKINGLVESDFIFAAKIDKIVKN
ncbi:MAG: 4a-hydroxytetrahydrobiopterin dehydratase [Epsilonproteobacteria bacterium]|nr:MAG: 4a-hydroxytetrahydrobiopterin dehydratase [Campylobacterota bacterium]RLA67322.1 MAG: 4a-hydroxytetrahydrobiopterin dehydratase [Campylobacterota bacterium]